jgi:outer membrane biosynthesis protein TonB
LTAVLAFEPGDRKRLALGTAVAIVWHGLIIAALLSLAAPKPHHFDDAKPILITLERPKPPLPKPPPPPPKAEEPPPPPPPAIPQAPPKPPPPAAVHRPPNPVKAEQHADPGPPVHFFGSTGSAPQSLPGDSGVTAYTPRAPSDYGDKIGAKINGGRGEASGPKTNLDCLINYQITVDRQGNLLSYKIDPCTSPPVNAIAEARIKAAAPYPPPPDTGAATYTIYRSQVFHYDPALGKPSK